MYLQCPHACVKPYHMKFVILTQIYKSSRSGNLSILRASVWYSEMERVHNQHILKTAS